MILQAVSKTGDSDVESDIVTMMLLLLINIPVAAMIYQRVTLRVIQRKIKSYKYTSLRNKIRT